MYAEFEFQTEDWAGKSKTALFHGGDGETVPILLGDTDTCLIPAEVLTGTSFSVSIIAGNLITANIVTVKLYESGYRTEDIPEPSQTLYEQLMTAFDEAKQTVIDSVKESESWAHGHSTYPERNTDNARYYSEQAKQVATKNGFCYLEIGEDGCLYLTRTENIIDSVNFTLNDDGVLEVEMS